MTPFAIAGVQMHVAAVHDNVKEMRHRLDVLMARFPWTQMVLFSELAPFGPLTRYAPGAGQATGAALLLLLGLGATLLVDRIGDDD